MVKDICFDVDYVKNYLWEVKKMLDDMYEGYISKMEEFQKYDFNLFELDCVLFDWVLKQIYIVFGNMMIVAVQIGIDFCLVEGFNYKEIYWIFEEEGFFEDGSFDIFVMVVFGYCVRELCLKIRFVLKDVVKWV